MTYMHNSYLILKIEVHTSLNKELIFYNLFRVLGVIKQCKTLCMHGNIRKKTFWVK